MTSSTEASRPARSAAGGSSNWTFASARVRLARTIRCARDARLRPLLQRRDQRVLRELLGEPDVAHHPGQTGDHPGGLDPPYGFDRLGGVWHAADQTMVRTPAGSPRHRRRRSARTAWTLR